MRMTSILAAALFLIAGCAVEATDEIEESDSLGTASSAVEDQPDKSACARAAGSDEHEQAVAKAECAAAREQSKK